jgi:hypothetical protein
MERELVWYGDIESEPVSDEQYQANLYNQVNEPTIPKDLSVEMLENVADFIPLVTDDLRMAFCQATIGLPENCQTRIWTQVLIHGADSFQPKTPEKKERPQMSQRMREHMDRWSMRKKLF